MGQSIKQHAVPDSFRVLFLKDYLTAFNHTMYNPFDLIIDSYRERKVGLDPAFLSSRLAAGLQQNILQLQHDNLMTPAGIGNDIEKDPRQQLRGDRIYWMDKTHDNIHEREFLQQVEAFIGRLNRTCYTGINAFEFHYAVYEPGSFYKRHKDQFRNDDKRKFSLINYLNEDWLDTDGGQLVVYPDDHSRKIEPCAQTAVFFKSDEMEHEVLTANRSRMSITGWLKRV